MFGNIPVTREAGGCEQCPCSGRDYSVAPFMADALGTPRLTVPGVPASPLLLAGKLDHPDHASCLPQRKGPS